MFNPFPGDPFDVLAEALREAGHLGSPASEIPQFHAGTMGQGGEAVSQTNNEAVS